jgi:hypothetical protein
LLIYQIINDLNIDYGRYIVRTPKIGVLIRDLNLKRDKDFGKETLLPKNSKPRK